MDETEHIYLLRGKANTEGKGRDTEESGAWLEKDWQKEEGLLRSRVNDSRHLIKDLLDVGAGT